MSLPNPLASAAGPAPAGTAKRHATKQDMEQRLSIVTDGLLMGKTPREVMTGIRQMWDVHPRTAYRYVQAAQRRLAEEAEREDPLAHLRLSRQQRERILYAVLRCVRDIDEQTPEKVRSLAVLATAGVRLLDSRDKTAAHEAALASQRPNALPINLKGGPASEDIPLDDSESDEEEDDADEE